MHVLWFGTQCDLCRATWSRLREEERIRERSLKSNIIEFLLCDCKMPIYSICSRDAISHMTYYKFLRCGPYFEGCVILIPSRSPLRCSLLQATIWTL